MFVAASILVGLLTVFIEAELGVYLPRHLSVSIGVGLAVGVTFWLLQLAKHPPLFLKNVSPIAAGICAGLGVHIARLWLK
jgi:hypothetical protein